MPEEQNDPLGQVTPIEAEPNISVPLGSPKRTSKNILIIIIVILAFVLAGMAILVMRKPATSTSKDQSKNTSTTTSQTKIDNMSQSVQGLQLDKQKSYGDKYANGILPVGDDQYTTDSATKGKVYLCNANFVPAGQAGAQSRGPWFVGTNQWDVNKKSAVRGSVAWQPQITNIINGSTRTLTTNGLPSHVTGVFPVAASDPAYQYDRNPNTIKAQSLAYNLASMPNYSTPQCMGGEVGVMLTGVPLFNAFDAGGRDAGAWEVQDACQGHPQSSGIYHYHSLSSCIKDIGVSTVIGFALDGFPITGPKVNQGNILTTNDLDECHGITSDITLDGKKVTTYHYVMTQDFPYSVSCFRAKPVQSPAQHSGGQASNAGAPPLPRRP